MDYTTAKTQRDKLNAEVDYRSSALNKIAGEPGPMGLTPDIIKMSPEYKMAKREFDAAFKLLRAFNQQFVKTYRAEIRQDRRNL